MIEATTTLTRTAAHQLVGALNVGKSISSGQDSLLTDFGAFIQR